jgi:hypothetical protein
MRCRKLSTGASEWKKAQPLIQTTAQPSPITVRFRPPRRWPRGAADSEVRSGVDIRTGYLGIERTAGLVVTRPTPREPEEAGAIPWLRLTRQGRQASPPNGASPSYTLKDGGGINPS